MALVARLKKLGGSLMFIAAALCAVPAAAGPLGPLADLQFSLVGLANQAPGRVGIAVEDIPSGKRMDVHGSADMPAASVIKIPVMVEVFRQMEAGTVSLNDRIILQAHDRDWGWGDLSDAAVGSSYTVDRLLRLMITESDNTATNMLIRRVSLGRINATMRALHLKSTVLGEDIRSEGNIRSLRTSPNDMVALLDRMAHEELVDAWSSREMLAILAGQQHNGLLPVPLPRGLEIAHKTGTLHDTLNDVGIVFLNDDPYAIAVMTTNLPTLDLGRTFIRQVSRVAYEAFSRSRTDVTDPIEPLAVDTVPRMPVVPVAPVAAGEVPSDDIPAAEDMPLAASRRVHPAPGPLPISATKAQAKRDDDMSISEIPKAHPATVASDLDQTLALPTSAPGHAPDEQMWASPAR